MREFLTKVPIPTAGVALGLAALGILLKDFSTIAYAACGVCSLLFVLLVAGRLATDTAGVRDDFENPILASVSATFFMAIMQLSTYLAPFAHTAAFVIWACAIAAHIALICWFTAHHVRDFDLKKVFPTWFICYVGIIVASVSSPTYGMETLGMALFWFGFVAYAVLLIMVSVRYIKHEVPEGARPLFCIYTAPMSLSLAGYLATADVPNAAFACTLAVLAQILLVVVLIRLPHFLRLPFYPSYAAMTFPFVITATALNRTLSMLADAGVAYPGILHAVVIAEIILACAMVGYVFARYLVHFAKTARGLAADRRAIRVAAAE